MIAFIMANKAIILGILFGISELLAAIPGIKANSIFQLIFGLLSKAQALPPQQ
jgi:TctA family transporter